MYSVRSKQVQATILGSSVFHSQIMLSCFQEFLGGASFGQRQWKLLLPSINKSLNEDWGRILNPTSLNKKLTRMVELSVRLNSSSEPVGYYLLDPQRKQ